MLLHLPPHTPGRPEHGYRRDGADCVMLLPGRRPLELQDQLSRWRGGRRPDWQAHSPEPAHTHTHTRTQSHTQSHTHTHSRTHTHTLTHAHTHSRAHTHTLTHTHTHSRAHTHTHTRTHACTHPHHHTRTHSRTSISLCLTHSLQMTITGTSRTGAASPSTTPPAG